MAAESSKEWKERPAEIWTPRCPGAQAAELCQVWRELCVREHQARDRNRQLLQDFGHLETQLGLLWARTDAIRRRKVDYDEFLQRLLLHPRMKAGRPGWVPRRQDWVSPWTLDLPLRSRSGRHLPGPMLWMDHLQYRTLGPHPVSPTLSPEPVAFLASTGAGGAGPMKGTHPQPTQTRTRAGAGTHTEDATSSGLRHRHQAANKAPSRLLWREAWEQDSAETAREKPWDRVPRLWCKEKPGRDTAVLDQWGSWRQEPWGEQAGGDRQEESLGKPRRRLSVRVRQPGGNRDRGEAAQLKGERGQVPIQGVGQLERGKGGEGRSAMGQTQKEEEEQGLAVGLGGQEREEEEGNKGLVGRQRGQEAGEKDEEGNGEEDSGGAGEEGEAEGRGSKEGSDLEHVRASANVGEDEEGRVKSWGQEEEGLAGGQGSKEEEGLICRQKGQQGGEDEEMEGEEGLAGGQGSEEKEEGSEEEEGLSKELEGQGETEEEEGGLVRWWGQEQGEEEESSDEEEGLGDQDEAKEEESEEEDEGLVGRGGQEQGEEEESREEEEGLRDQDGAKEEESEEGSKEEEGLVGRGAQEQREEEEGSEEEEGLQGQQGGHEGREEEEGSEGLAVRGTEGHMQEEEDTDSDLVLGALGAGAQECPGSAEQRSHGRETPAWNSRTPEPPQNLGQDSSWEEEEEEEAESEGDEDIEAALAPQENATDSRVERRTSESHEWRRGSQRSPRLEEGSRKVKVVEALPASNTQWPGTPPQGPAARSVTGFWGDSEKQGAGLEMLLRKDQSPDDQDDFYD